MLRSRFVSAATMDAPGILRFEDVADVVWEYG
jgi:hypothetical protein